MGADGGWPPEAGGTWVIDLDGVIWLAGEPIAGSDRAVRQLRDAGIRPVFATNNSAPTMAELLARLERAGIAAGPDDLVTSAQAAAQLVTPGSTVLALADGGAVEALSARGVNVVERGPADIVLVGWTHRFDFDRLAAAATAVREGAHLLATNEDPTYPTPGGLLPGAGALLAAVATASGVVPDVAGKPHQAMADLVAARRGDLRAVVGDRPSTDGELARRLGAPFALVLSGVTTADAPPRDIEPAATAPDLARLVDMVLGG